jgi:hypothetical protein
MKKNAVIPITNLSIKPVSQTLLISLFLPAVFTFLMGFGAWKLYNFAIACEGFNTGDWLYNYAGGFVRRGLSGFVILSCSDFLKMPPNIIVFLIETALYFSFLLALYFNLRNKKFDLSYLVLLLSPVTLIYPLVEPWVLGKKEIILFLIFTIYVTCLHKRRLYSNLMILNIVFSILLFIATLIHELVIFYIPYFLLAVYIKSRIDKEPFQPVKSLITISGPCIATIIVALFGLHMNTTAMCSELQARGLPDTICESMVWYMNSGGIGDNLKYFAANGYLRSYSISFLLGLLPFVFYILIAKPPLLSLKRFIILIVVFFLFSTPLFVLALDWGRWINIHFIMMLITTTLLLNKRTTEESDNFHAGYYIPRFLNSSKPIFMIANYSFFSIVWFLFLTTWKMKHYGYFSVFREHFLSRITEMLRFILHCTGLYF